MSDAETPRNDADDAAWIDAGAVSEFELGAARQIPIGELRVAVFRGPDDTFHGLADSCPHAGAPLSAGALRDGVVVCTWHGFRFDPATGRCANVSFSEPVPTHAVRVADGRVLVSTQRRA